MQVHAPAWFSFSTLTIACGVLLAAPPVSANTLSHWEEIAPGGDTICARGAPFSFFVRSGDPSKVIIDFIGGGACWDGRSCAPGTATFTDSVDSVRNRIGGPLTGVYNDANPDNPYQGWTHVVIPYCSGDLHWGNATRSYQSPSGTQFTIHHKGAANTAAVLNWVKERLPEPIRVHVNGCSAGSYGSIFWSPFIQEQYPNATLTQFGDAGAGILVPGFMSVGIRQWDFLPAAPYWVPGLNPAETDYNQIELDQFYSRVANHYPQMQLSQFTTSYDFVQTFFYTRMGGRQDDWNPAMRASFGRINGSAPNFRSFIARGDQHCATVDDDFYTVTSGGTQLSSWLKSYVNLQPVSNVDCDGDCE